ncbi:SWIRM-domain-containing protein [Rhizopus microsporus ATCC 52813]|uniref:SWIRM-domain-containing protein n=2 Tax=Rhizopus microsporus TaxID=58291 RepID=A0A2G4T6U0_RHIZD|nr:SWIRM-domain-containing protein [Rhizopus microsporus ATCC 52813]PHZ16709.1 SWIRM-domain-containing protein [Rhizopus microsporus ATCC 52813]
MDTNSPKDNIKKEAHLSESENNVNNEQSTTKTEPLTTTRSVIEVEARKYLMEQTKSVKVPSYASWFDFNSIHPIERVALPEFFTNNNSSKTPAIYQDYRDFMINTYRLNPKEYLTVTACRRSLAGDVCAIMRVHAFLEQWGLINSECDPFTWPSSIGPPYTGHFRVTADTPRGLAPYKPNIKPSTSSAPKGELNIELRQKVFEAANGTSTRECFCITCGAECSRERYHSLKIKNMDLCPLCYKEGRFPASCFSSDFIHYSRQQEKQEKSEKWSDEETLLLLEAIELYDDDWNTIADYVGTKTREQCIYHFLQLPIEDPYRSIDGNVHSSVVDHKRIPFSQADNPVMSILAFLASTVDPEVASTAAKAAIACQEQQKRKNEDAMELDKEQPNKKPRTLIEKAASVALGSAAAKAKSLSSIEEREIRRLVHSVLEAEIKKVELKMNYFDEMEAVLEYEMEALAQQRKDVFTYRLSVKKTEALLEQEINKRGGVEMAIENGWAPQELQQLIHNSLFKEDYHLADMSTLNESTLVHPSTRMDESESAKDASSVLCL